jgi:hypothetical protein
MLEKIELIKYQKYQVHLNLGFETKSEYQITFKITISGSKFLLERRRWAKYRYTEIVDVAQAKCKVGAIGSFNGRSHSVEIS